MPQVRPIADIKANLLRPATTSNFEVEIPLNKIPSSVFDEAGAYVNKTNEWRLRLLCTRASLPGSELGTTEIMNDRTGVTEFHVNRRNYDPRIDFTFYVNADNYIPIRVFECWMDYCVNVNSLKDRQDTKSPNYFYRMRYPDEYIADTGLKIVKFERDHSIGGERAMGGVLEYEFIRAFPIAISSMPIQYDGSELLEVTVSFSYVRYIMNKGYWTTGNTDPVKLAGGIISDIVGGNLGSAWNRLTSAGIPGHVANAAANSLRSIVAFAFGDEAVDKLRGGSRWVSNTWNWLSNIRK